MCWPRKRIFHWYDMHFSPIGLKELLFNLKAEKRKTEKKGGLMRVLSLGFSSKVCQVTASPRVSYRTYLFFLSLSCMYMTSSLSVTSTLSMRIPSLYLSSSFSLNLTVSIWSIPDCEDFSFCEIFLCVGPSSCSKIYLYSSENSCVSLGPRTSLCVLSCVVLGLSLYCWVLLIFCVTFSV